MLRMCLALSAAFLVAGCAGSPVGDAIAGPEKLAQEDDAYCRSIGAAGPNYTNCRIMMTQRRDTKHARALAVFRSSPMIQCITVGNVTTCN